MLPAAADLVGTARRQRPDRGGPGPRHPFFVDAVLQPLADRRAAGESHRALSRELYERHVHRWALQRGHSLCRNLPAHADRHEVVSQALRLAWDACDRIDWARVASWPALLEAKVAHARIEAARSDDWLSRRERMYRRRYQAACDALQQQVGRALRPEERRAAARATSPSGGRVDWGGALVADRHPTTVAEVPEPAADLDVADEVEAALTRDLHRAQLGRWLQLIEGQDPLLADDVRSWIDAHRETTTTSLPGRLLTRLSPYRPTLIALVHS
jgi:hypothetical protein